MAVARALLRMAEPVLLIKLGCDGNLSIISAAARRGGFDEDKMIVQLYNKRKRSEQIDIIIKRPSRQGDARRRYLQDGRIRSCMRRYERKMSGNDVERERTCQRGGAHSRPSWRPSS